MNTVTTTVLTHPGSVRQQNEDRVGVFGWRSPTSVPAPIVLRTASAQPLVVVVADGLGGHLAGEVAAEMAVTELMANPERLVDADALVARYLNIHELIFAEAHDRPDRRGMGTTLAAVVLVGDQLLVANVGDSRVYYVEPGFVEQLTTDDVDPLGTGALTQVIGGVSDRPVDPAVRSLSVGSSSRLVLCSDGVHGFLPDTTLHGLFCGADPVAVAVAVERAVLAVGAPDNFSLCLVDVNRQTVAPEVVHDPADRP